MCPAGSPAGASRRRGRCEPGGARSASPDLRRALALAVVDEAARCLGPRGEAFAFGLARLFAVLVEQADAERLAGHVALVGRDFALLAQAKGDHIRCAHDDFIVIPLTPIFQALRERVWA